MSCFIGWDSTYANTERERANNYTKKRHIEHINHTPCCTHLHRPKRGSPLASWAALQLFSSPLLQHFSSALQFFSSCPVVAVMWAATRSSCSSSYSLYLSPCLSICKSCCNYTCFCLSVCAWEPVKVFAAAAGALLTSAYANTSATPPSHPNPAQTRLSL